MRKEKHTSKILATCLDGILHCEETIDSALEKYPHLADKLRPQLEAAARLNQSREVFKPRPGYISASLKRLVAQIQAELAGGLTPVGLSRNAIFARLAFAMIFMLTLLLSGGGVALAADDSLPGEGMYSLKIALEDMRLLLTTDKAEDAELHIQYAHNRVGDILALVAAKRYSDVPIALDNHKRHIERANQAALLLAGAKSDQTGSVAASLAQALSEDAMLLEYLKIVMPVSDRILIEDEIGTSEFGEEMMLKLLQVVDG
jgi:hypothetical protein